jgi:hypothetical protein
MGRNPAGNGLDAPPPEQGDRDAFEDLMSALAVPGHPAAVTVMHASPELTLDTITIVRRHYVCGSLLRCRPRLACRLGKESAGSWPSWLEPGP